MSTTIDNQIVNLQFNNKDFEKNAAQSLKTVEKLKKNLDFSGVKSGFETIASGLKKVTSTVSGAVTGVEKFYNVYKKLGDVALHPVRSLKELGASTEAVSQSFSKLEEVSIGALRRLGEQAVNAGERLAKSLTIDQVSAGWEKFGEKTRSVASIMSATGMSAEEVTEKLKKLNWYTDETSYAYTDMTNNIGKFTNAGIKLDDAITAMIGIGNAAGLAGSSVQDASHAMEGFSGAIAQGYMDRQRWSWIKTAHMDTVQFKEALIDAAVAEGVLEKGADGVYGAFGSFDDDSIVTIENFENAMTKAKWLTTNVMTKALKRFGGTTEKLYEFMQAHDEIEYTSDAIKALGVSEDDLGLKAFKASQEARTLSDAIDSVKDAVSTGFMTAFEHFIGNYEQAKDLWTDLANTLWDIFAAPISTLNDALDEWSSNGGFTKFRKSLYQIMDTVATFTEVFKQGWTDVFGEMDGRKIRDILNPFYNFADRLEASTTNGLLGKLADVWYNFLRIIDEVRKTFSVYEELFINAFSNSGLDEVIYSVKDAFSAVEETIDEVSEAAQEASEYVEKAFQAVSDIWTKGSLGNGEARVRALEALGLDPKYVQKYVNQIAYGTKKSLDEVHEQMVKDGYTVGEAASEGLEEVEEEESGIVRISSKLGKVLGGVADAIRAVLIMDDSVHFTIYDIFLGFWSLIKMVRTAIDQFGQSMKRDSGLTNIIHWIIDPIANVARTITDMVANGGLLKVRAIVSQLITLFNSFSIIIRDFGKAGSEAFHNAFGGFDILDFVRETLSGVVKTVNGLSTALKQNNRLTRILSGITSALKIVTNLIAKLFNKVLKPAGKKVLPSFLDVLAEIGDVLTSFAEDDVVIDAFFYAIVDAFDKAKTVIGTVVGVIQTVIGAIASAISWVIDFASTVGTYIANSKVFQNVGTVLKNLADAIAGLFGKKNDQTPARAMQEFEGQLEKGEDSFSWLNVMLGVVESITGAFSGLIEGITNVISWVDKFIDKIQNGTDASVMKSSVNGTSGNIFTRLSEGLSSIFTNTNSEEVTKGSTKFFGDVLSGISTAITNFFKDTKIDWSALKDITAILAIIWSFVEFRKGAVEVNKIITNIGKVPLSFADIFKNFNDILTSIKGTVGAAKTAINNITQAQVVESYIYALLAIAGAVVLLGKIPENQLIQGVSAMVVLGIFFGIFAKAVSTISTETKTINKITNSGNKTFNLFSGNTSNVNAGPLGMAFMILSMAAFALAVVNAIQKLVDVLKNDDVGAIYGAVGILAGFFIAIIALVAVFTEASKKLNNKQTVKFLGGASKSEGPSGVFGSLATVIGAISVAVGLIGEEVVKMAKLPRTRLDEAQDTLFAIFVLLGGMMAEFALIIGLFNKYFNNTAGDGDKATKQSETMVKQIKSLATTMILIATAVDTLIPAIAAFAVIAALDKDGRILQGTLLGVASLMAVMAGIVALFAIVVSKTGINSMKSVAPLIAMTACMVVIAAALDALLPVIAIFGLFEALHPGSIVQVAVAIGLIIAAMGVSLWLATKAMNGLKAGQIISLAVAVVAIAAAFSIIIESIGKVILAIRKENVSISDFIGITATIGVTLVALMAAFMGMATWLNQLGEVETKDIYALVVAIAAIAGSMLIVSAALSLLAKNVKADDLRKYATAIGVLVGALLAITGVLMAVGGSAAIEAIKGVALMLAAMAGLAVGISVGILVLAVAIKVFAENLPRLIGLLPKFGDALAEFCKKLDKHKGELVASALAFAAFAAVVGVVIVGLFALIVTAFNALNKSGGLPAIGKKTMLTVAAIILGICAALTQTSPEVLNAIESVLTMVMAYLGEIMGALVEAVMVLVLEFLDRLADAIDNNSNYIWYIIVRILMSIGNLIMSGIGGLFYELVMFAYNLGPSFLKLIGKVIGGNISIIGKYIQKGLNTIKAILTDDPIQLQALAVEDDKLDKEIEDLTNRQAGLAEDYLNTFRETTDWSLAKGWWNDFYSENFDKDQLAEAFGVEPRDYAAQKDEAIANIKNISKDYGKQSATSAVGGFKEGLNDVLADIEIPDALKPIFEGATDASGQLDTKKLGEGLGKKLNEFKEGVIGEADLTSIQNIIPSLTGEMNEEDIASMMEGLTSEYTGDLTDLDSITGMITGNIGVNWGNMTDSVTDNFDAMATSQQALIEATAEADKDISESMDKSVTAIESYKKPFYQSGFMLVHELKRGMETEMGVTKEWLIKQMAEIIDSAYSEWKVNSPSKLFNALGQFAMEGLAIGLQNDMPLKVMQQSINDLNDAVTFGQFGDIKPRITPVVDLSNARQTATQVDSLFKVPSTSRKIAASASQYVNTAFDYVRNDKYNDTNVVNSIGALNSKLDTLNDNMMNTNIYLDSGALVGATSGPMDKALGQRASRIKRGG